MKTVLGFMPGIVGIESGWSSTLRSVGYGSMLL
jgi:hypothetical protein